MTEAALPAISVVIPTFNRLARLKRVLQALSQQTLDEREFEVIAVSDGCTDGTDDYLAAHDAVARRSRSARTTPVPALHAITAFGSLADGSSSSSTTTCLRRRHWSSAT